MIQPKAMAKMNPMAQKIYNKRAPGQQAKPVKTPRISQNQKLFERPIPGQSLTRGPRERPYERPPEITDPEEALQMHLTRLNDVERLDAIMVLLEKGVDVRSCTEGILRSAVSEGIHSIDVSLICAAPIHEFISDTADAIGVSYSTGFEENEAENEKEMALVRDQLDLSEGPKEVKMERKSEEPMIVDKPTVNEGPKGLMSRV
jgi:hypothetical protein